MFIDTGPMDFKGCFESAQQCRNGARGEEYNPTFSLQVLSHGYSCPCIPIRLKSVRLEFCMLPAIGGQRGHHRSQGLSAQKGWGVAAMCSQREGQVVVFSVGRWLGHRVSFALERIFPLSIIYGNGETCSLG